MRYSVLFFLLMFSLVPIKTAFGASCSLNTEQAYKSANTLTVYYITRDCTKRPFTSAELYYTYFNGWNETKLTTSALLAAIPNDANGIMPYGPKFVPKNGDVIKTLNDPKVYFVIGNELRHIENEVAYTGLGYKWDWIINVDQKVVDRYAKGDAISYFTLQPLYALFKQENDPKIYRLEPHPSDPKRMVYRHIANEAVFKSLGYRFDRVLVVDQLPESIIDQTDMFNEVFSFSAVSIRNGINPMGLYAEGEPINAASDVRNIDVRTAIMSEQSRAQGSNALLQYEPLYGISFEYPDSFSVEGPYNGIEQMTGSYQISLVSDEYPDQVYFFNATPLVDPVVPVQVASVLKRIYTDRVERQALLQENLHGVDLFMLHNATELQPYMSIFTDENLLPRFESVTVLQKEYAQIEREFGATYTQYATYSVGFIYNDTLYVFGGVAQNADMKANQLKEFLEKHVLPTISVFPRIR